MIVALVFILVIILLVIPHELGHFAVAKWFGIRVDEFGIGFLKRLWSRKIGETEYSINILPLGGFVKIFGEEEDLNDPRSFSQKSFLVKSLVVAAGVIANTLVAFVLFSILAWHGMPQFGVEISEVVHGSPAEIAGIKAGDIVERLGERESSTFSTDDVRSYIEERRGNTAKFGLLRRSEHISITSYPRRDPPPGEGPLGIRIGVRETGVLRAPWYRAPYEGALMTASVLRELIGGLALFFGKLFSTGVASGDVIGPIGIAGVARDTLAVSITYFLQLIAFLSLNLAVINILPLPALDGGRIFFFVIEKVIRRPIPARVAGSIHSLFFLLFIALLVWVTWRDIVALI